MKFIPILLLAGALILLIVACGGGTQPLPDVEATVEARIAAERAADAIIDAKARAMAKAMIEAAATPTPTVVPATPTPTAPVAESKSYSDIAESLRPSVVRIQTTDSTGTGFIIGSNGAIVTNAHVVGDALSVDVILSNGTVRNGLVLGRNQAEDLALLDIDGYQLPTVELHYSGRPRVGEEVLAMGYALNLPGTATLTKGMVSAYRPNAFGSLTALQTDTAINPGNSGGPLVDLDGRVVGINTAGIIEAEGINFAIVMDEALAVINSLMEGASLPLGRFVSSTYPFTIAVPKGEWNVYEITPWYVHLRNEASSATMDIMLLEHQDGVTTDQFANAQIQIGSNQELAVYEKHSAEKVTLSTLPAWEVVETWKHSKNDFYQKGAEYFLVYGGLGYSIYTQSEQSEWDAVRSLIDEIIESFVIDLSVSSESQAEIQTVTPTSTPTPTPLPEVAFFISSSSGSESANLVDLEVRLTFPSLETVLVDFGATNGTASGGGTDFLLTHGTLAFGPGDTSKALRLQIVDDPITESTETIIVSLSNPVNADLGTLIKYTYYIIDNDITLTPTPTLTPIPTPTPTPDRSLTGSGVQFGPIDGSLAHDTSSGFVPVYNSNVSLSNAVVEATFVPPHYDLSRHWSSGFTLRGYTSSLEQHIVVIGSNGYWYHKLRTGDVIAETLKSQYSPYIAADEGSTNHVRVITLDDVGWLFINGHYVAELDFSGGLGAGDVALLGAWFTGDVYTGESTGFKGFTVRSLQTAYGPESGAIDLNADATIPTYASTVWLADTIVEVRFDNPYSTAQGDWSPGFLLRNSAFNTFHVIVISSSGYWYHGVRTGEVESEGRTEGYSQHISISPSGSNVLRVIAMADEGWLFINGAYIGELDLSGHSGQGEVFAIGSYFSGHGIVGKSVSFDGFSVWSVGTEQ